jgi:chromosome segregation ATPase
MKKLINSQLRKIFFIFILLFSNKSTFASDFTKSEISEIATASLSLIYGVAANVQSDQESSKIIKLCIMHNLISVINDCLTIYNYKDTPTLFTLELLTFDTMALFADIKDYIDLIKNEGENNPKLKEQTHIIHALKIILPLVQGIANATAAFNNDDTQLSKLQREKLHGIALLATLTNLFLKAKTQSIQNTIAGLIILNAGRLYSISLAYNEEEKRILRQRHNEEVNRMRDRQMALQKEKDTLDASLRGEIQKLRQEQQSFRQEQQRIQSLHARIRQMEAQINRADQEWRELDTRRIRAEQTYKNALTVLEEEKKARERAETALQRSGESQRYSLFSSLFRGSKRKATPEELKAAYEALLKENAISID